MKLTESNLEFEFVEGLNVVKFDETDFYKRKFQYLPNAKGVDFVADSKEILLLIEVKNCKGYESDNRYRIAPNNSKVSTAPTTVDVTERESLDIEVSKKIAMTLACLVGVHTKHAYQIGDELKPYSFGLIDSSISEGKKAIKVLLFLEGAFETHTRSKKTIMRELARNINIKLSWLNCDVFVEDLNTQQKKWFSVTEV